MVAQCAGCNVFEPWAALLIGLMAGVIFNGVTALMLKLGLDDPLDAVAVHAGGGILGVLCVPFFKQGNGIFWIGHESRPWLDLGVNLAGLLAIIAWALFWSTLIFASLRFFDILRVDKDAEIKGNDIVKHGESAYPKDAWIEMQYQKNLNLPPNMTTDVLQYSANCIFENGNDCAHPISSIGHANPAFSA